MKKNAHLSLTALHQCVASNLQRLTDLPGSLRHETDELNQLQCVVRH